MKDYINAREEAKNKRNKIELHFKKINGDKNEALTQDPLESTLKQLVNMSLTS